MSQHSTASLTVLLADTVASSTSVAQSSSNRTAVHVQATSIIHAAIVAHAGTRLPSKQCYSIALFPDAREALAAALEAHRNWSTDSAHRSETDQLRIALHVGPPEMATGMAFGTPLNRAYHLLQACPAGRILASQQVTELLAGRLPPEVILEDLGRRRLKDLLPAEHLFTVRTSGMPSFKGSLGTLDAYLTNLPVQPTPFLGRIHDVAAVQAFLETDKRRLVTLVAPSGIGKTRFALEVATRLLGHFPDGVFFISLAPIEDPELVIPTIARTLGIKESGASSMLERLKTYLRERRVLLVIDNIEQVIDAAPHISALLAETQHVQILVTSHLPLQLPDEQVVAVPPLAVPDPEDLPSLDRMADYDAIALFIERILAVDPAFVLDAENAPVVAKLCRRVGGTPLAIELVAACGEHLSPPQLLEQLLAWPNGKAEQIGQHLTLHQVLDWSYAQLDSSTQVVLARLGVFVEGCTLEAAEAVCQVDDDEPIDVLNEVGSLLRRNLLLEEELVGGDPRYIMLDCVHEYAWAQLVTRGEVAAIRHRHTAYYCGLRELFAKGLRGTEQSVWLQRAEGEHNNIRAALRWSIDQQDRQAATDLCLTIWVLWTMHGYWREGCQWLEQTLALADAAPAKERASLHFIASILHALLDEFDSFMLHNEQALALFRELDEHFLVATTLHNRGVKCREHGRYTEAKTHFTESLAMQREIPGPFDLNALTPTELACIAIEEGEYATAQRYLDEARAAAQALDEKRVIIEVFATLGLLQLVQDDLSAATRHFRESLLLCRELGGHGLPSLLEGMAGVAVARHQPARAARLLGAMEALCEALGREPSEQRYHRIVATARAQSSPEAFADAWTEGRAMGIETAITFALDEPD